MAPGLRVFFFPLWLQLHHFIITKTRFLMKPRHFFRPKIARSCFPFAPGSWPPSSRAATTEPGADVLPSLRSLFHLFQQLSTLLRCRDLVGISHVRRLGGNSERHLVELPRGNAAETPHDNSKTASLNNRRDGSCTRRVAGSFWKPSPVCPCPRKPTTAAQT